MCVRWGGGWGGGGLREVVVCEVLGGGGGGEVVVRWTGRRAGKGTGACCVTWNQYQSQVPAIELLYMNNHLFKSLDTFLLIYV